MKYDPADELRELIAYAKDSGAIEPADKVLVPVASLGAYLAEIERLRAGREIYVTCVNHGDYEGYGPAFQAFLSVSEAFAAKRFMDATGSTPQVDIFTVPMWPQAAVNTYKQTPLDEETPVAAA